MKKIAIMLESTRAYARAVVEGVAAFAQERRDWILRPVNAPTASPARLRGFDGIIARILDDATAERLAKTGLPIVDVFCQKPRTGLASVESDHRAIGRMARAFFESRGFANFGYCGMPGIAFSDKRQDVVTIRIDRMDLPEVSDEDTVPPPENYNVQDYTDVITRMYAGSRKEVVLRCCTNMIDQVIDKFGKDVHLSNINLYTFDATVTAAVSGTFLSWVFQYAGQITILSPEPVREMYADMLRTAMEGMDNTAICRFKESGDLEWKL